MRNEPVAADDTPDDGVHCQTATRFNPMKSGCCPSQQIIVETSVGDGLCAVPPPVPVAGDGPLAPSDCVRFHHNRSDAACAEKQY